ncbi:MAG: hypothetical protein IJF43_07640 [Firmicutes bacterium]|nr:hypothetical protein [Bacillota bacterium]
MGLFILFIAVLFLGICLFKPKGAKKNMLLFALAAIIYFPIGVIIELTKNYK